MAKKYDNQIPPLISMPDIEECESIADHNLEKQVLSALVGMRNYYDAVAESLCPDSFDNLHHRNIFNAIKSICEEGGQPDQSAVWQRVQSVDKTIEYNEFALMIMQEQPHALGEAVMILDNYRKRRAARYYGMCLAFNACNISCDIDEEINAKATSLVDAMNVTVHDIVNGGEVQESLMGEIEKRMQNPDKVEGILTGYRFVDNNYGLHPGDCIVLAGESSSGKSSLAISIIDAALDNGGKVAYYSLEMSKEQIQAKLLSMNSGVKLSRLLYAGVTGDEYNSASRAHVNTYWKYQKGLYYLDKFTRSISNIMSDIRSKKKKVGINIAVIDYLQISVSSSNSRGRSGNREAELADNMRSLRNLAQELEITIIVLSQLNRDKDNPFPTLARLRGSGQIGEAATDVWLIYRPGKDENTEETYPAPFENMSVKGTAMVNVDKCRFAKPGRYLLGFDGPTTKFYEMDQF